MIYPITFSIAEEHIIPYVPYKTCHTAKHDYQFQDSESYLKNYRNALFGETLLKCGWDCLRHYEILSQGTIPYFHKLENCPKKTMFNFPKEKLLMLRDTYGPLSFEEIMKTSSSILYNEIDELLNYTRKNLTTQASAKYLLSKTVAPTSKKILYLSNQPKEDYLSEMLVHGLYRETGGNIDIFPDFEFRYKDFPIEETKNLYGKGFNYTRLLEKQKKITEQQILENIKERHYDQIILYNTCQHAQPLPFINAEHSFLKYYSPNEISAVCGRDCDPYWSQEYNWYIRMYHDCPMKNYQNNLNVFIREFGD